MTFVHRGLAISTTCILTAGGLPSAGENKTVVNPSREQQKKNPQKTHSWMINRLQTGSREWSSTATEDAKWMATLDRGIAFLSQSNMSFLLNILLKDSCSATWNDHVELAAIIVGLSIFGGEVTRVLQGRRNAFRSLLLSLEISKQPQ